MILAQPDKEEKIEFISALRTLKTTAGATLEAGLDDQVIANLVARTPNASLEEAFLASARTGKPLTHASLIDKERADVVAMSEGTLSLIDTERVKSTRLVGRTIERLLALLARGAEGLRTGDRNTPMNYTVVPTSTPHTPPPACRGPWGDHRCPKNSRLTPHRNDPDPPR